MKKILQVILISVVALIGLANLLLFKGMDMHEAKYVLNNAKIPGQKELNSIIYSDKMVQYIIPPTEVYKYIGKSTKLKDLNGNYVIEGFKDSHIHLGAFGKYNKFPSFNLANKNISPKNDWVIQVNLTNQHLESISDNKFLNQSYPDSKACVIHESFHMMICNNNALDFAGIKSKDGIVKENESFKMFKHFPADTIESIEEDILKAQDILIAQGIFSVDNMDVPELEVKAIESLIEKKLLKLKVNNFIKKDIASKYKMNFKIYLDGALGSETAAMNEPYQSGKNGKLLMDEAELIKWMQLAYDNKVTMSIHQIGDKSYDFLCDTYEKFNKKISIRVEHAQHIKNLRNKDFIYSVQPLHYFTDTKWINKKLNLDQIKGSYRWKSIQESGATLLSGSDAPVAYPNINQTIKIMIDRKNIENSVYEIDEAINQDNSIKVNSSELKPGSPRIIILEKDFKIKEIIEE